MRTSAGLLPLRVNNGLLEVFLVHPGGPFWAARDDGAWSICKGEYDAGEEPLAAARREFTEETGFVADGEFVAIGTVKQKGGKEVIAWIFHGDFDPALLRSSTFEMEWPPKSGRRQAWPEVDRAAWLTLEVARRKILPSQLPFLDRLSGGSSLSQRRS
jgi:predicted NUDIX family NTP pyrophosphohydrolase